MGTPLKLPGSRLVINAKECFSIPYVIELGNSLPPDNVEAPSIHRFQQDLARVGKMDKLGLQSTEVQLQAPAQTVLQVSHLPEAEKVAMSRIAFCLPCFSYSFPPHPPTAALGNALPG